MNVKTAPIQKRGLRRSGTWSPGPPAISWCFGWSGGNLPDDWYDEFVFTGFLSGDLEAGKTLYFPVVQECEKGVHRWIEIPAGKTGERLDEPAPGIKLLAK